MNKEFSSAFYSQYKRESFKFQRKTAGITYLWSRNNYEWNIQLEDVEDAEGSWSDIGECRKKLAATWALSTLFFHY